MKDQAHLIDNVIEPEEAESDDEVDLAQTMPKVTVIDVTKDNIDQFSLEDIVMPMVGYETRMPRNADLQNIVFHFLAKDGVSLDHFQSLTNVSAASASGGYRKIVAMPE